MRVFIDSIPHADQRYDTLGDWWWDDNGTLQIRVSRDGLTEDEQGLIALHEVVEAWLCRVGGITQEQVDEFDMNYAGDLDEPGDAPGCPYGKQHRFAMLIEHLMAYGLGLTEYGEVK